MHCPKCGHEFDDEEPGTYTAGFLKLWELYPRDRRKNKPDAWRAWKGVKAERHLGQILASLELLVASRKCEFVPFPASFLRSLDWKDAPPPLLRPPAEKVVGPQVQALIDRLNNEDDRKWEATLALFELHKDDSEKAAQSYRQALESDASRKERRKWEQKK